MTNYCGDFRPSDTVRIPFTTVNPGGVPSQLSGAPALAVYAMGSVMSAMVAGVSVIVNMGSFTGQNVAVIDTSQDTIAYAQGVDFAVTITSGYAGSLSSSILVGYNVGHFSINNRSLRNTTSIAQLGVNVVTIGDATAKSSLAAGNVNVVQIAQAAVTLDANNLLKVDVEDIAGNAVNVNAAQLGVNAVNIAGVVAATSLAIGNATVAKFTPGIITTAAFTAGALATTVFPTGVFIASLFDATAENAFADALLDRTNGVETGVTPRQSWRGVGASAFGALSGAGTGNVGIWGGGVASTTRLSAVTDQSGNRLSVTVNL